MPQYEVTITKTESFVVYVEAEDKAEASRLANEMVDNEEIAVNEYDSDTVVVTASDNWQVGQYKRARGALAPKQD